MNSDSDVLEVPKTLEMWKSELEVAGVEEECPICYQTLKLYPFHLPQHPFCQECAAKCSDCPMCRAPLTTTYETILVDSVSVVAYHIFGVFRQHEETFNLMVGDGTRINVCINNYENDSYMPKRSVLRAMRAAGFRFPDINVRIARSIAQTNQAITDNRAPVYLFESRGVGLIVDPNDRRKLRPSRFSQAYIFDAFGLRMVRFFNESSIMPTGRCITPIEDEARELIVACVADLAARRLDGVKIYEPRAPRRLPELPESIDLMAMPRTTMPAPRVQRYLAPSSDLEGSNQDIARAFANRLNQVIQSAMEQHNLSFEEVIGRIDVDNIRDSMVSARPELFRAVRFDMRSRPRTSAIQYGVYCPRRVRRRVDDGEGPSRYEMSPADALEEIRNNESPETE